jgi:hypothetical protein
MDKGAEGQTEAAAERRRAVFRAAQKTATNIYLFRRLKWGWPRRPGVVDQPRRGGLSVVAWMLVLILAAGPGFIGVSLVSG